MFRAEVALALELAMELTLESGVCVGWAEVHLFICVSSMSVHVLWCHFRKEDIRACGLEEADAGVFLSQPSPCDARETQHPASSLLGPWCEVT